VYVWVHSFYSPWDWEKGVGKKYGNVEIRMRLWMCMFRSNLISESDMYLIGTGNGNESGTLLVVAYGLLMQRDIGFHR
jgi:hypothetical protein